MKFFSPPKGCLKTRVTVIIPNYNGRKFLPICLGSLRNQEFKEFVTIVVDNGSNDGSIELIRENYPEVEVISLKANYGFSFAVNRGIERSSTEYVALLNNDVEVTPKWLGEMVCALDMHKMLPFQILR